jgi:1D-myo-inositol 3-kinase
MRAVEVLLAGHYCHDTILGREGGVHRELGGSSAYGASVLGAAGVDFAALAKVGDDFAYADRVAAAPIVVRGAKTTTFIDDYRSGERVGTCPIACEPIAPGDVQVRAQVAIACAIAGEVPPEILLALRAHSRVLLADAQGLLRRIGPRGEVDHVPLEETAFAPLVGQIDYLKLSEQEARACDVERLSARTRIVITQGERGCTLIHGGARLHVPGVPAIERDATGAGDCFLAGLAIALLRNLPIERALSFANWCGAQAVQSVGIPRIDEQQLRDALAR